jgi:GNAT superfamily N-acetyltransferase
VDGLTLLPGSPWDVFTFEQRPDASLWAQANDRFADVWPEYNMHASRSGEYFGPLRSRFARYQVLICDPETGEVVGRGRQIPLRWDGTLDDLPGGIDAAGLRAVSSDAEPNVSCALAAEVARDRQGQGLSRLVIQAMAQAARAAGARSLIAPVRPNWKDRYPVTPIERYTRWKRPDGLPFDPWVRVHARLGATILRPEPESMWISAPVADWEEWTGMLFPEPGTYTFPAGLAPLTVLPDGTGEYWEPNIWMLHELS